MNEKGLGLRLQKVRKEAGFTQQDLCQKSGLSYSTLAKIERGAIKSPSIFTIQQIAAVLGTTIDELMGIEQVLPINAKKTSNTGIKFVYFDINGCLVGFFHRAFSKISIDYSLPLDFVESTCWHYNDAVCRGDMTLEEYNGELAKTFNLAEFDWAKYYLASVDPIPQSRELITWASENYHIGLLSNIMPGLIDKMIDQDIIPNLSYDQIIDSSQVGAIKPEPKIFEFATKKAKVDPEEILLVDDSRSNLMAAEKQGWRVSWFDDYRPDESASKVRQALEF